MHPLLMLPAIVLGVTDPVISSIPNASPPAATMPAEQRVAPGELHWIVPAATTGPDNGIATGK
jgi:hypothetical protein